MLVGRDDDVRSVISLIDDSPTHSGQLRLIQIDGSIGAGKSALLSHVIGRLRETDDDHSADESAPRRIFVARGDRLGSDAPLIAFRMMIEQVLGASLEQLLDTATPSVLAARCAEALGEVPVIVAVDDAQWLDAASEAFLIGLMQTPLVAPLTVLLVHRIGQAPPEVLHTARGRGALHDHLTVGGLSDEAIRTITRDIGPQQVRSVTEMAHGNPLFAHIATAAFRRHPEATRVDEVLSLVEHNHAETLATAVATDLASLGEAARRTLEALAVTRETDVDIVAEVSGLDAIDVRRAAHELTGRGLLSESSDEALHPVVRFSVYRNTDAAHRARLHLRAASRAGAELFDRADHLAQIAADTAALAGGEIELGEAEADVLVAAAGVAIGSDPAAVLGWLRALPDHLRSVRSETLFARALLLAGDFDSAIARLRALVDQDASVEARALLANALRVTGHTGEARALLAAAQESVDPHLLREYIDILALVDGFVPDDLLSRLESVPGDSNRAVAAIYRTMSLLGEGRVPQARVTFQRALDWLTDADGLEVVDAIQAITCAAWAAYMLDRFETGARIAERALALARRHARTDVFANLGTALLFCHGSLGLLDAADAIGKQAIRDAERYGTPDTIGMARAGLMVAAQGRADPELLRTRYEELIASPVPEFGWWRRAVLTTRTRVSALVGAPEPCPELLGKPRDAMAALRFSDAAVVSAALGDRDTAQSLIDEALAIAESQESYGQRGMVQVTQAEIMLSNGEALQAGNLLREARDVFERVGMRLHFGRAQAGIARADAMLAAQTEPLAALTTRERQIAELVAAGLKNGEIADRLVLSRRTPEQHVRNILKKLGLQARTDIVTLVNGGRPETVRSS